MAATNGYADNDMGADNNTGLTPDQPKKTIAAAMAVRGGSGTLYLSRYSTWTSEFLNITVSNTTVRGDWNNPASPSYVPFPPGTQIAHINRNSTTGADTPIFINACSNTNVSWIYCTGGVYGLYRNGACPGTVITGIYSTGNTIHGFGADVGSGDSTFFYCTADGNGGDGFNVHQTFVDNYWYCVSKNQAGTSPNGDGFSNHDTATLNMFFCQSFNNEDGVHQTASVNCIIGGCYFANNRDHQIRWEPAAGTPTLDAPSNIFVAPQVSHLAGLGMVGIWSSGVAATSVYLYNCIFNNRNTSASQNGYCVQQTSGVTGKFFISGCQFMTDSTSLRAWYIGATGGVSVDLGYCDYNSYQTVTVNTSRFRDGPALTYDFAGWQARPGTPDAHSLMYQPNLGVHSADPLTPDYYRPMQSSPQFLAAGIIPALFSHSNVQDIDQRPRLAAGNWYVGAFIMPAAPSGALGGGSFRNFLDFYGDAAG